METLRKVVHAEVVRLVSEGLNSVETNPYTGRRSSVAVVSEGLNSVETQ